MLVSQLFPTLCDPHVDSIHQAPCPWDRQECTVGYENLPGPGIKAELFALQASYLASEPARNAQDVMIDVKSASIDKDLFLKL